MARNMGPEDKIDWEKDEQSIFRSWRNPIRAKAQNSRQNECCVEEVLMQAQLARQGHSLTV